VYIGFSLSWVENPNLLLIKKGTIFVKKKSLKMLKLYFFTAMTHRRRHRKLSNDFGVEEKNPLKSNASMSAL